MSSPNETCLINNYNIESIVKVSPQYEINKAYSILDGKEVLYHKVNVTLWKDDIVDCFLNALKIVQHYSSYKFLLECFASEKAKDCHTIDYITEYLSENVASVFAGIGSVRLKLVRKWLQDLLTGLADLHSKTESHEVIIHGRIRLQNLLYFRSTGQVRMGGYFWLTNEHLSTPYPQIKWAEEDDFVGYYAPEVFSRGMWTPAVDIYALAMCVIHLLSGCQPFGELSSQEAMKASMLSGDYPQGLNCIQSIDESLYQMLLRCLAPVEERPTASVLLKDPFFTGENNPDIQLKEPRVMAHPNNPLCDTDRIFSRAFEKVTHAKSSAPQTPISSPSLRNTSTPQTPQLPPPIPSTPVQGPSSIRGSIIDGEERRTPMSSLTGHRDVNPTTSTNQSSLDKSDSTHTIHISMAQAKLPNSKSVTPPSLVIVSDKEIPPGLSSVTPTPISMNLSVSAHPISLMPQVDDLMKNTSQLRKSLPQSSTNSSPAKLPSGVTHVELPPLLQYVPPVKCSVRVRMPGRFLKSDCDEGYLVMIRCDVDLGEKYMPWKVSDGLKEKIEKYTGQKMDEKSSLILQYEMCEAICAASKDICHQLINEKSSYITLKDYLIASQHTVRLSVFIPSFYVNDDAHSSHLISVRFSYNPIKDEMNDIIRDLVAAVVKLREESGVGMMELDVQKSLTQEIRSYLDLKMHLLLYNADVTFLQSTTATVTHYCPPISRAVRVSQHPLDMVTTLPKSMSSRLLPTSSDSLPRTSSQRLSLSSMTEKGPISGISRPSELSISRSVSQKMLSSEPRATTAGNINSGGDGCINGGDEESVNRNKEPDVPITADIPSISNSDNSSSNSGYGPAVIYNNDPIPSGSKLLIRITVPLPYCADPVVTSPFITFSIYYDMKGNSSYDSLASHAECWLRDMNVDFDDVQLFILKEKIKDVITKEVDKVKISCSDDIGSKTKKCKKEICIEITVQRRDLKTFIANSVVTINENGTKNHFQGSNIHSFASLDEMVTSNFQSIRQCVDGVKEEDYEDMKQKIRDELKRELMKIDFDVK